MLFLEHKDEKLQEQSKRDFDTLEFALHLVAWIPSTLKDIMHSDDDADLVFLAVCFSLSILAIRTKNDISKGGK